MKIYQLIEILQTRSLNDEVVIPCGPGQITDAFSVIPIRAGTHMDNLKHVALFPIEGDWHRGSGTVWNKAEPKIVEALFNGEVSEPNIP